MENLKLQIQEFNRLRDWNRYHSPKNLSMALAVEAAELMESFQWMSEDQSRTVPAEKLASIRDEIGDIQIYLINIADKLGVDLLDAAQAKLKKNEIRYPVAKARGNALKYNEFGAE